MDWADDTAYSLNDLADGVAAGFLTGDRILAWAEENGIAVDGALEDLVSAIRRNRIDGFTGNRIGRYIQAAKLVRTNNLLSNGTRRYQFALEVDPEIRKESELFKKLAFELVFLSPQLKQLEHKGNVMLRGIWEVLEKRYIRGERIDGQDFQLLPGNIVAEIEAEESEAERARLICDVLAGATDGLAGRLYKRLFVPDFGSIGDLMG